MSASIIGLDFGTTNTVLCLRDNGETRTLAFDTRAGLSKTLRTVLAIWQDPTTQQTVSAVGRDALSEFSEFPEDTRLIQSLKSYAANNLFRHTIVYGKPRSFADLMHMFLVKASELVKQGVSFKGAHVVAGRPVTFAGFQPDETVALERYREVFTRLGVEHVSFVMEPVAAAYTFARKLTTDATVLIADLGGGTTDFSILRLDASSGHSRHEVLATGGIGIAGDQFDYRIMEHAVLPLLGKGTQYRSMGKILELPRHAFESLARWNELSFLRQSQHYKELKKLAAYSLQPELLDAMFDIVDDSKGLALNDQVAKVKQSLSISEEATLAFENLGGTGGISIARANFEMWIGRDLQLIEAALDVTLEKSGKAMSAFDAVFLTGGTSLVPAVRKLFAKRFGAERLHGGDELVSVGNGLIEAGGQQGT